MADRFAMDHVPGYGGSVRRAFRAICVASLLIVPTASANPGVERVRGFFCNAKHDQVEFLTIQARGENEEMAANAVNRRIAKFSCAYFTPATAIHTGEETVIEEGLVFKLHSYLFLPEKVERWSGTVFGSLSTSGPERADI